VFRTIDFVVDGSDGVSLVPIVLSFLVCLFSASSSCFLLVGVCGPDLQEVFQNACFLLVGLSPQTLGSACHFEDT
jgi:hypothetical protein